MEQKRADQIIAETREMYDRIAPDFSRKRSQLTPDVLELVKYSAPGQVIADIGCGSGRLSELFPKDKYSYIGCDFSDSFLKVAASLYPDRCFVRMQDLQIPIQSSSVNTVYCLAMLHHIPSHEYRLLILEELKRVLVPDGTIVCTVWKQPVPAIILPEMDEGDLYIPYTVSESGEKLDRYIHAFSIEELKALAQQAGFKDISLSTQQRGSKVVNENILLTACKP